MTKLKTNGNAVRMRIPLLTVLLCWFSVYPASESMAGDFLGSRMISHEVNSVPDLDDGRRYWVFFHDRGFSSRTELHDALSQIEADLSEHRRQRLELRSPLFRRTGRLADQADLPVHEPYIRQIEELLDRQVHVRSRWLNAVSIRIDRSDLDRIALLPCVLEILAVRRIQQLEAVPAVPAGPPPGGGRSGRSSRESSWFDYGPSFNQSHMLRVPEMHELGFTGAGIIICCMDTGFNTSHQALQSMNIIAQHDFIFNDDDPSNSPEDHPTQHNHGTGVVAVIGAFVPGELIGPAFGASFILAKTEDVRSETRIEEDNWVAGMEWADSLGADVISSSLAYRYFDDGSGYNQAQLDGTTAVTTRAANSAVERGIVVSNAMGNEGPGPGTLSAPADAFKIFSCGAVDSGGHIADFSSRGPTGDGRRKPEVCAQGVSTRWAVASDPFAYGYANGTSLSTPLIGAVAALILQAHPDWTPIKVRQAICFSASRYDRADSTYGYGIPDLVKAMHDPIRADIDGSGRVDGLDHSRMALAFGSSESEGGESRWEPAADLNDDGLVDGADLALFSGYFGNAFPSGF